MTRRRGPGAQLRAGEPAGEAEAPAVHDRIVARIAGRYCVISRLIDGKLLSVESAVRCATRDGSFVSTHASMAEAMAAIGVSGEPRLPDDAFADARRDSGGLGSTMGCDVSVRR
jgi:hypothetical protein